MMLGGFAVAYYMYVVNAGGAGAAGAHQSRCSTASCSTSGISTNSTTSSSCGRRSAIGRAFWKGGDRAIIDGLRAGRRLRPRARRRRATPCGCRPAMSTTTRSRCCSASRGWRPGICSGESADVGQRGCLSAHSARCRLIGALFIALAARRDRRRPSKTRAGSRCSTTVITFFVSLYAWALFDPAKPGFQLGRGIRLVLARHPLQARRRRRLDAVRAADDLPDADLHPRLLAPRSRPG